NGRIFLVGRTGMDDTAWAIVLAEVREVLFWEVVVHLRLFLGIEMIEIAEELIEAVIGRQHVIKVAEMVLAELAGGIALVLQGPSYSECLFGHADGRARDANLRQTSAQNALTGDEGGAAVHARMLPIRIEEHDAFDS